MIDDHVYQAALETTIAALRAELAGAREVLVEYDKLVDSLRARVAQLKAALIKIADNDPYGWEANTARAALKDAPQ